MEVNKISFHGVYKDNKKFTPVQNNICRNITETLTSKCFEDSHGRTPDVHLKQEGYDTLLIPIDNDKISVNIVKHINKKVDTQTYSYTDSLYVGTYDRRALFSYNDIRKVIKENSNYNRTLGTLLLVPLFITFGLLFKNCTNKHEYYNKVESTIKNLSDNKNVKSYFYNELKTVNIFK